MLRAERKGIAVNQQTFDLSPKITCRRLLAADLPALDVLNRTALPQDARPTFAELHAALVQGELWGWFSGEALRCCGIFLPLDAPCRLCVDPAALTGNFPVLPRRQMLIWAPAVAEGAGELLGALAQLSLERAAAYRRGGVFTALPVRARAGLAPFLAAGFVLVGLRPLLRLCPCWLLLASRSQTDYNKGHELRLDPADTRLVGRRLEEGWRGVALEADGSLLLIRDGETNRESPGPQEEQNETGDSGFVCTQRGRS